MKVISYIPTRKTPLVIFIEERLDEKTLHISHEFIADRQKRYKARLDAMLEFAYSDSECRNNLLLKYFGQPVNKPCGACDICKSRLDNETTPERIRQLKEQVIDLLEKNPAYFGELQMNLEIKEESLNQIIHFLSEDEKIKYLPDGRLSL